jgi:hypothetical protein
MGASSRAGGSVQTTSRPWGDRWTRRVLLLAAGVASATGLAACTSGGDEATTGGDGTVEAEHAAEEFEEGPAPAASSTEDRGIALRVDEVARDGDRLRLRLTLGTSEETLFRDHSDLRLITSAGVELARPAEQERTLPPASQVTIDVEAEGLEEATRTVTLDVRGLTVDVEVPEDGQTRRWRPAPERQVGFVDGLMRDAGPLVVVPYTFRTEGMVSELTFFAQTWRAVEPRLCEPRNITPCYLEDQDGRAYPLLGEGYEFPEYGQARGTMRFLGEIPRDVTDLRLRLDGRSGFMTIPHPSLEYAFSLPLVEDSPLRAAAEFNLPDPFDVGLRLEDEASGMVMELGEMAFAEDRIQLDVRAVGGDRGGRLNWSSNAVLRDPSGFEHRLLGPPEDRSMAIDEGETIEATLVFLGRVAPGTTQLEALLGENRGGEQLTTTIEIPGDTSTGSDTEDDQ